MDLMADIVVNVVERMVCIIAIAHMTEREAGVNIAHHPGSGDISCYQLSLGLCSRH